MVGYTQVINTQHLNVVCDKLIYTIHDLQIPTKCPDRYQDLFPPSTERLNSKRPRFPGQASWKTSLGHDAAPGYLSRSGQTAALERLLQADRKDLERQAVKLAS